MKNPIEEKLWDRYPLILGMDEAGRGPLCGPVCIAGVVFPAGYENESIQDSKKISEKKRNALYHQICEDAIWYQIVMVDEETIDRMNIYRAVQKAMEEIAMNAQAAFVLTDAMPLTNGIEHEAIVKGDSKAVSIAAASILAKVSRDRYMEQLDSLYPEYGLARHKGYPTKAHLEVIEKYGVKDFYRKSFGPVRKQIEKEERLRLF